MPEGMFLKSECFASNIADPDGEFSLRRFCAETDREYADIGVPISLETFVAYGEWFQERAVPDAEEVAVTAIDSVGKEGFRVSLASGEVIESGRVVLAGGLEPFVHVPQELRSLQPDLVSHPFEHRTFRRFAGKKLLVVGAGQSALETAALLHEAGATTRLVARGASLKWNPRPARRGPLDSVRAPMSVLGSGWKLWSYVRFVPFFRYLPPTSRGRMVKRTLGPAGAWWLRSRVESVIDVAVAHRIVAVERAGDHAQVTVTRNGVPSTIEADHVISATGFEVDVDRIPFLSDALRTKVARVAGSPRLSPNLESSVPGLYFVGLPAAMTFGPLMRFVCGSGFAARRVARHVAHDRS
jgi:cation diffusion facilitator CzcD-associated flavoprotein CzcO